VKSSCDFYIGLKQSAQWIGSCRGDNIFDIPRYIIKKRHWYKYFTSVIRYIGTQTITAIPLSGDPWLWVWPDSRGSDYAFYFDLISSKVFVSVNYYENYCDAIALSKGESLQDADLKISVVYPKIPKELISLDGQNPTEII
jgi:hypothetical protein